MTKARALQLLERHIQMFDTRGELGEALDALRPKARTAKAQTTAAQAACKTILKNLRRPDDFGSPRDRYGNRDAQADQALYLDSFGPVDSPERDRQAARLKAMQTGPDAADYGKPAGPSFNGPDGQGLPWEEYETVRREHDQAVARWQSTPEAARFEADRARHEARRDQFAYVGLKASAKDDERAVFALAVLDRTTLETREELAA